MKLLDLPVELLIMLPSFLRNIEDFLNAGSSCRKLRAVFAEASPRVILQLAAASSRVFFRPDPHFLVAATVRQVGEWALLSPENTKILRKAFRGGIDSLFELCLSKAGLSMEDIRRLHSYRFSTINPVVDLIDRCAGVQWYSTPDFWEGGVSDACTISVEASRALFQIVIYGELFSSTMLRITSSESVVSSLPCFDLETRLDYIVYCIPDPNCQGGYEGFTVLDVGPYAYYEVRDPDQVGLDHLLNCRSWREAWEAVQHQIGPDFEDEWRQKMWHSAVQMQGLEGLEMLRPGGVDKWRHWLQEIRARIEALDSRDRPRVRKFGSGEYPASDSPCMAEEILVAVAGYWDA